MLMFQSAHYVMRGLDPRAITFLSSELTRGLI